MFGRRRKIIARGPNVYIFEATRDSEADFLTMTMVNKSYHRPWVFPATDSRRFGRYLQRIEKKHTYGYFVGRNVDDRFYGVININDVVMGGIRTGSLGYYADAELAGMGYMLEALALVIDHAFLELDLNRLEANVQPENAASISLVRKLGFRREGFSPKFMKIDGVWRDHERWAMLHDEWLANSGAGKLNATL